MKKTYKLKVVYDNEFCRGFWVVKRKYFIFWITVKIFFSKEEALAFDYCEFKKEQDAIKAERKSIRRDCSCD